ncbi:MAG TPA: sulfite exporter TauE/SafE family protein [Candidatus Cybelea sp.]|nr:sulfite exporter TauE/SafE family protein [Candidatus Cybelea sp.]
MSGLQAISDWFFSLQIYLPIAEVSLNVVVLLAIGGAVGLLSGLFGVGGGFLMTPLLIFIGVPPAVAVATQSNQVVAASVSGVLAHWSRDNVDFKMGFVLLGGGILGSSLGVLLFSLLRHIGQIDLVIAISYVLTLGSVGTIMAIESINAIRRVRRSQQPAKLHQHNWAQGLPFKMRFRKSRLYISAVLPVGIGFVVGIMSAIMGVGGAFLMVPAMIYILGMPTSIVIGTSLFQIIFVQAYVTILQSVQNQTVDLLLALILTLGGVIGAQYGGRWGARLPAEQLRLLMALVVLAVAGGLLYQLVATPDELYAIITLATTQ